MNPRLDKIRIIYNLLISSDLRECEYPKANQRKYFAILEYCKIFTYLLAEKE